MSEDHSFCRSALSAVLQEVSKHTTVAERKAAWAWFDGNRMGDFHGPADFYHYDRCHCRYDMKRKGWQAWLNKFHKEGEDNGQA